ncbi:hypothetical protein CEP52_017089 [Fusarium oligoseptatum]|uniref:Uncharacterized protein n=1 Tax=Fusarium oligoseptatum TaxID=2604345 RepID=A0A428RWI9_9HYPO|nr:hypothetical protein CEP52_017089 [Fusarium oligoseptatum]
MVFPSVYAALEPYLDVPFNASLSAILLLTYRSLVSKPALLLTIVLVASAVITIFDRTSTKGEMIKTMAELPLGLGSVLLFIVASRPVKARWLHAFTIYVNFAVYGNIVMMVATPSGDTFSWSLLQGRLPCAVGLDHYSRVQSAVEDYPASRQPLRLHCRIKELDFSPTPSTGSSY